MAKKKVLIICNSLCLPSVRVAGMGAIYQLIRTLSQREGWEIHVLTSLPSWGDPIQESGGLIFHYLRADNLFWLRLLFFIKAVLLQRRFRYDLIHDYSSLPLLVGVTGWLGKICRCRVVHTLCTANTSFLGSPSLLWGLSGVGRVLCTDRLTRQALVSKAEAGEAKIHYLPLGIDLVRFGPPLGEGRQSTVLFIGPLRMEKGALVLAKAAEVVVRSHPEVHFVFASYDEFGESDLSFKRSLARLGKQATFLSGRQDVSALLSRAALFVLPATSRHGTLGQPQILLEAMASGKACLVSDVQRGDGLVEDGVNCVLFRSGNPQDLARKLLYLLSRPRERERLGRMAREKVVREFDMVKVIGVLVQLYTNLL